MISVSTRCANPNHQVTSIALNRVSGFLGFEIDKDASLAIITPLPWPTPTDGLLALVGAPNGGATFDRYGPRDDPVGLLHTRLMPSLTPLRLTGN